MLLLKEIRFLFCSRYLTCNLPCWSLELSVQLFSSHFHFRDFVVLLFVLTLNLLFTSWCNWSFFTIILFFWGFFFHKSVTRRFSTGVWVTVSFLKSPGLFLVFWSILIMLWFGWSPFVLLFPSPPVPVPILWWLYLARQSQMISPPLSCSIVFLLLLQGT